MLSLADGTGWAPIIMARVFVAPPLPGFLIGYFVFAATFKECGSSIIELSYLVKPSHFNMSMSVKTVAHLSNEMFDYAEFLMTLHVCEEQLSHFLVFLMITFQKVHIFKPVLIV